MCGAVSCGSCTLVVVGFLSYSATVVPSSPVRVSRPAEAIGLNRGISLLLSYRHAEFTCRGVPTLVFDCVVVFDCSGEGLVEYFALSLVVGDERAFAG